MKTLIGLFFLLNLTLNLQGQSVALSKVMTFLENQNSTEISQKLNTLGFKYVGKDTGGGVYQGSIYGKKSSFGVENFAIYKTDELFSIVYKIATLSLYSALKEKILNTKDDVYTYANMVYLYTYKSAKYYENNHMRIGFDDSSHIISFFVNIR